MFFVMSRAWDKEKILSPDSALRRSDALPLSHRDSTVSKVYYKVHMTRVLHTAKINNPIYKTGRKGDESDYRPFSVVPLISQ